MDTLPPHNIQLRSIYLESFECKRLPNPDLLPSVQAPLRASLQGTEPADGQCFMRLTVEIAKPDASDAAYYLSLAVVAVLVSPSVIPADQLREFIDLNGVHLLWPYARQAVQDFTSRLGLQPTVLPVLQVVGSRPTPPGEASIPADEDRA